MDSDKIFNCISCNKIYKSYMGFWKHNKKYHTSIQENKHQVLSSNYQVLSSKNQVLSSKNQVLSSKKYKCRYCDKSYDILQSRWFHEQKCKIKNDENNEKLKIENNKLRALCAQAGIKKSQKYEIELLNNNNQIITTNNNNQITTTNNNSNNNNTVNNTVNIIKFGTEKLQNILILQLMSQLKEYTSMIKGQNCKI